MLIDLIFFEKDGQMQRLTYMQKKTVLKNIYIIAYIIALKAQII